MRFCETVQYGQSHYIKVAQGGIFMEQNMRFGLILGRLAILKKNLGQLGAIFDGGFFMFSWVKRVFQIF